MTSDDLKKLKAERPDALRVWYDRMHDLSKGQLVETLLTYMTAEQLTEYLLVIEQDIQASRQEENQDGPR